MSTTSSYEAGRAVCMLRKISGLTRTGLARECELKPETIKDFEGGNVGFPSRKTLTNICQEFGIPIDTLVNLDGRARSEKEAFGLSLSKSYQLLNPQKDIVLPYTPKMCYARVLRLIRIFREIPYQNFCYNDASGNPLNDTKTGISYTSLQKIEGYVSKPNLKSIQVISNACGLLTNEVITLGDETCHMTERDAAMYIADYLEKNSN